MSIDDVLIKEDDTPKEKEQKNYLTVINNSTILSDKQANELSNFVKKD